MQCLTQSRPLPEMVKPAGRSLEVAACQISAWRLRRSARPLVGACRRRLGAMTVGALVKPTRLLKALTILLLLLSEPHAYQPHNCTQQHQAEGNFS